MTLFLIILTFQITYLNAQESRFKEGETLNVWAQSGLNMRDKPDAKATKITTIPYGAKVIVQPNIGVKIPFEVEEFKGFIVKGYWLLVKYGDTEGFVFDGFLSRLPAPESSKMDMAIIPYLNEKIGKVGKPYKIQKCDVPDFKDDTCVYIQKYRFDIELAVNTAPEVGGGYILKSSNFTFYEAYIIVKTFFFNAEHEVFSFNKKENAIKSKPVNEEGGCYFDIRQEGKIIVIEGSCGC